MGAVAQYLTYSSQESKFVSSNPATLNAFTVGDLLFKSQTLWRVLIRVPATPLKIYFFGQSFCRSGLKLHFIYKWQAKNFKVIGKCLGGHPRLWNFEKNDKKSAFGHLSMKSFKYHGAKINMNNDLTFIHYFHI